MSRNAVIEVLQAGRAIAALAVVVYHAVGYTGTFATGMPNWVSALGAHGYLGVDFFFVLSGFIMAHVHRGDRDLSGYWRTRLERIFIPYLPIGLGMALLYTLLPGISAGTRDWSLIASVTLLPATGPPALIVAWTLQHELLFYAVFGLGLLVGRPLTVIAAWAAMIAGYNLALAEAAQQPNIFLHWINIEFLFGVVAARLVGSGPSGLAPAGAIAVLLVYVMMGADVEDRIVFALATALGIIHSVDLERRGRIKVPRSLVFLGAASYAIYLVHNPIQSLAARLFDHWGAVLVAACVGGTIAGIAFHLLYERPLVKWFKAQRTPGQAGRISVAAE